jgi:chemotaxis protein methyltransferase CheR
MTIEPPTDELIDRVADLLLTQIGLRPEPSLRGRLRRSIRDGAIAGGQQVDAYVATLTDRDALQGLLNRVTVQETAFFRHPEQFAVLAREILPHLPQPVTIWSAGCANGQEAYTLAMVLDELGIAGSIIATDLSTSALQRTEAARYSAREIGGLSPERIARHLTRVGDAWQVNESIRSRVTTMRHNLLDPPPAPVRASQVIFCRNVLIYFTADHIQAFLDRVADAVPKGAYLFLGSAETIWPTSSRFETVRIDNSFFYRHRLAVPPAPVMDETHRIGPAHRDSLPSRSGRKKAIRARRGRANGPAAWVPTPACVDADTTDVGAAQLARLGQEALESGECLQAIVAFRKWVYLAPDDAIAHLHLGLALEATGDQASARRAFSAARRALLQSGSEHVEHAIGGYAADELLRLLDSKGEGVTS